MCMTARHDWRETYRAMKPGYRDGFALLAP
jgi:hypothetical protein